jgi:hypothetical protein
MLYYLSNYFNLIIELILNLIIPAYSLNLGIMIYLTIKHNSSIISSKFLSSRFHFTIKTAKECKNIDMSYIGNYLIKFSSIMVFSNN